MMIGKIKSAPDVEGFEGGVVVVDGTSSGACRVMTESDMASSSMLVSGDFPECVRVNCGTVVSPLGANADGVRSSGLSYGSVGNGVASGSEGDMSLISVGVEGVREGTGLMPSLSIADLTSCTGADGL
jgi:hypothetical protein